MRGGTATYQELLDCTHSKAHKVGITDNANWCEKRKTLSARESTAFLLFEALSAYSKASRKCCGEGGGAIKAERLVLAGVHTRELFQEGILHLWVGCPPGGEGKGGGGYHHKCNIPHHGLTLPHTQ